MVPGAQRENVPAGETAIAAPSGLADRLGLSVPHEWWPSPALLKSYEAAGFSWVQLHSPPAMVLAQPRLAIAHAREAAKSLSATSLRAVVHAPGSLRVGSRATDRAFEGLLSYAAEVAAEQVIYHALALPDGPATEQALSLEAAALSRMAPVAERLGLVIAVENLAPLYPAPETLSATPLSLRGLVQRIGSDAVAICLDVGHAHVVADGRNTRADRLCEPVLDLVSVVHAHDNFGSRRNGPRDQHGVDPLRLDLHLPPGRGTLPWNAIGPLLRRHRAPVVLEVHPPYRPRAAELASATTRLLGVARRQAAPTAA